MKNITFLFGAGASAGTEKKPGLPVIKDFDVRLLDLINYIQKPNKKLPNKPFKNIPEGKTQKDYHDDLIRDLNWLKSEASNHSSVDTFAKKLFLMGERRKEDLKRLKISLSMFLIFEQARRSVDMRYDTFFASILEKDVDSFPQHIRILSWNYDYQFEKAFSQYLDLSDSDSSNLLKIQERLHVISKFTNFSVNEGFSIIKLNGTTRFSNEVEPLTNITTNLEIHEDAIHNLVNYYAHIVEPHNKCEPLLSFAWEVDKSKNGTITSKAIACTKDTHVLVVIGYSFPFFNREVDRTIIREMKYLNKVYFQAPDAQDVMTRFQSVLGNAGGVELVPHTNLQSFLLPDEL